MIEDAPFIGVVIKRQESPLPPSVTGGSANIRQVEPIGAQDAPDPVRQSDFVSRAAKWPKAIFMNIPGIRSIMQDEFGFPTFAPPPGAHTLLGPGPQLTWDERSNIQGAKNAPYGTAYEVVGVTGQAYPAVYAKLLG